MADYLPPRQTLYSSHLGFRLPFLPIFSPLPTIPSTFSPIYTTENLYPLDLDIDGTRPLEKTIVQISAFDYLSWVFMQNGGPKGPYYYSSVEPGIFQVPTWIVLCENVVLLM